MNTQPTKLILIDGSSLLYRSFFGVRPLHTSRGEPTHALYGFWRTIKKRIDELHPTHMVLVWDSKGPTVRHEEYSAYKATRQAPPSDLITQKEAILQFAETIGLCQLSQQGLEADDLLYSLVQQHVADEILVVTGDKDLHQMLTDTVHIYDPFKQKIITKSSFIEERGFEPKHLLLYHSLLGDASDNIPGVKGVGKKTAEKLTQKYLTLEELYKHLDEITPPRIGNLLRESQQDAELSAKLFTLRFEKQALTFPQTAYNASGWLKAKQLFHRHEIKPFYPNGITEQRTLFDLAADSDTQPEWDAKLITTKPQLDALLKKLSAAPIIALDTETTSLQPFKDEVVGLSCAVNEQEAYYIPFGHITDEEQLDQETVLQAFKPLLADPAKRKVLHSAKFDQTGFARYGIQVKGITFDTLIAACLLRTSGESIGLKNLSLRYFNEEMATYAETAKKAKHFGYVPLRDALRYAAHDARQTLKLYHTLKPLLEREEALLKLFTEVELPTSELLLQMEITGITLDAQRLATLKEEAEAELQKIVGKIGACLSAVGERQGDILGGVDINLNSPAQVEILLFDQLKLTPIKKSAKTGKRSTDNEVLNQLSKVHPVPGLIIQYRELAKLINTYLEPLPHEINARTGRVHTTYSQTIAATGRLSSAMPNLQNIPVGGGFGHRVREAFVAKPGHLFLSADYSQIELRVLAHFSGDPALRDAFIHNKDIHRQTAAQIFDVAEEAVTNAQRQVGKKINFSIMYGLTPFGLSKDLDIPPKQAKAYIDAYFERYAGVKNWMDTVIDKAKADGYVSTLLGRRRYVPGLHERNRHVQDAERRVAINTPIQGTTADLMKLAMLSIENVLREKSLKTQQLLQIHDELLLEVPEAEMDAVKVIVEQCMDNVVTGWDIPLEVSLRAGETWGEAGK